MNLVNRKVVVHSSDDGSEEEKRDGIRTSEIAPMGEVNGANDDEI